MTANQVENLVNWYLRFNGYFTVPNFTVHPDTESGKEAEADFLAIRFPFSTEQSGHYEFARDNDLVISDAIDFLIAEVKSSECVLNKTWTNPERKNIQYALQWMGFLSLVDINCVAEELYNTGHVCCKLSDQSAPCVIRMVSFGRYVGENSILQKEAMPGLLQIELERIIEFVRNRVTLGCPKPHRENWDPFIQQFALLAELGVDNCILLQWILGRRVGVR